MSDELTKKVGIDPISGLIKEADAYTHFDQIEKLVEDKHDLSVLPIQPVYLAIKSLPIEKVAELLPRFSKEQRTTFLDIDLWVKDDIDVNHFPFWLMAYYLTKDDDVKKEFVTSEQFLIYLKSKFNIWTFDAEEPEYPDHDNYFLTDDNQLLIEFDENAPFVSEVKELIKHLYYELGVENAYTFLFKMVSDSFLTLQEDEYRLRKERLRDFGFVDYIDALEIENPFINLEILNNYLKKKTIYKVELDPHSKNQNIHNSALVAFKDQFKVVIDELLKIADQSRLDYLQFNFIRLINARLESTDALKKGSVAMSRSGAHTKNIIQLGFSYLFSKDAQSTIGEIPQNGIFEKYDFVELYKIGNSLLIFNKKKLKKALHATGFESEEAENFLGEYWSDFLDNSFDMPIKFQAPGKTTASIINDYDHYCFWQYQTRTFCELLPFAKKFHDTFKDLKKEGRLQDSYYLNFTVDSITFETLLITSFANYFLGTYSEYNISKLGLTLEEFKSFTKKVITSDGHFVLTPEIFQKIVSFANTFGLNTIFDFNQYMQYILKNSLEGYDFQNLSDDDFKHVGGPIILCLYRH